MSSSPHDALFKAVFSQLEHARGALRSVVPAAVAEELDWASLAHSPGSFVDPALSGRHTDLLFTAAWHGGGEALAYLLFEHQSTTDSRMAFRLLRYLVRIWEHWLDDHPEAKTLPVIVPLVLYHGAELWSVPLTFEAMFDVPDAVRPAIAPHLVRFSYPARRSLRDSGRAVARTCDDSAGAAGHGVLQARENASGPPRDPERLGRRGARCGQRPQRAGGAGVGDALYTPGQRRRRPRGAASLPGTRGRP